jgi:hypothetical protein
MSCYAKLSRLLLDPEVRPLCNTLKTLLTHLRAASCASTTASGGKLGLGCEGSSSLLHSPVTPFSIHFLDTSTLLYLHQHHKHSVSLWVLFMVLQHRPAAPLAYSLSKRAPERTIANGHVPLVMCCTHELWH